MVFDDDLSYLDACAGEIRKYGLTVTYAGTHAIVGTYKSGSEHMIGVIRKLRKIPFYQAYLIETKPQTVDFTKLVEDGQLLPWVLTNREDIKQFVAVDISGHEHFQTQFLRELKERFK